jgi:hypothetical protein
MQPIHRQDGRDPRSFRKQDWRKMDAIATKFDRPP